MRIVTKIENLKRVMLMAILTTMSLFVVSCGASDDDDPAPAYGDFYIEFSCSGGGFTQQELTQMNATLNSEFSSQTMEGISKDQAIYVFDSVVKNLKQTFKYSSDDIVGTLNMTLFLKTTEGKVVKQTVIYVTSVGVS